MKKLFVITLILAAPIWLAAETWIVATTNGLSANKPVLWQYDKYRDEIARAKREEASAAEFNQTNTNPLLRGFVSGKIFQWDPQKGQIELGYRGDGIVVWRELPEGK